MLYVERENSGHLPNGEQEGDTSEIMETSIMEGEEYYNQEGGEWTQKVDTGQLCRVCANPNDYLIPIFDGEGLEHELSMKIQKHLPIKVTETDTLPQHMCYQCASTLIAWHDLVISCVEADKKLRELQMEENDDDDDKGGEMFESPSLDSEMTDDVIQPSTSETQNQNQVSKTPSSKKAAVAKEKKSKLKMILVKGPPAGTSGQKTASKTQVAKALELAKSKDGVSQDSASERCQLSPLTSFKAFQEAKNALRNMYGQKDTIASICDMPPHHFVWIKCEEKSRNLQNCHYCNDSFRNKSELEIHMSKLHSETTYRVKHEELRLQDEFSACTEEFPAQGGSETNCVPRKDVKISKHIEEIPHVPVKKDYLCEICDRSFTRKYDLKRHSKCHTPPACGAVEETEIVMVSEVNEKCVESDWDENDEKMDFDEALNDDDDEDTSKMGKRKRFQASTFHCIECGKNFSLKDSYFRHMRIHTGEKPFTCHICGKQFRDSGGLARHLKDVHARIKNFSCDICGRCFASKATREDHRRIHTGERPYICDSCGKTFKSKASLYIHSKIHTDSFPHECSYCEKRFRRRQELLAHVTTHTGEKPHACDVCGRCFRVRGELLRHKLIHSEDKPYVCSECGLSFRQKRYLKNHQKTRHSRRELNT
ncbi:zinc finger protein 260-like isoform X17 [Periplaneta americana]|uniref:zinc finger protein 260-like isoform X17 n=1 Tax=Periplaneta americana TaxID=6978 RepID=UPI0037E8A644